MFHLLQGSPRLKPCPCHTAAWRPRLRGRTPSPYLRPLFLMAASANFAFMFDGKIHFAVISGRGCKIKQPLQHLKISSELQSSLNSLQVDRTLLGTAPGKIYDPLPREFSQVHVESTTSSASTSYVPWRWGVKFAICIIDKVARERRRQRGPWGTS